MHLPPCPGRPQWTQCWSCRHTRQSRPPAQATFCSGKVPQTLTGALSCVIRQRMRLVTWTAHVSLLSRTGNQSPKHVIKQQTLYGQGQQGPQARTGEGRPHELATLSTCMSAWGSHPSTHHVGQGAAQAAGIQCARAAGAHKIDGDPTPTAHATGVQGLGAALSCAIQSGRCKGCLRCGAAGPRIIDHACESCGGACCCMQAARTSLNYRQAPQAGSKCPFVNEQTVAG